MAARLPARRRGRRRRHERSRRVAVPAAARGRLVVVVAAAAAAAAADRRRRRQSRRRWISASSSPRGPPRNERRRIPSRPRAPRRISPWRRRGSTSTNRRTIRARTGPRRRPRRSISSRRRTSRTRSAPRGRWRSRGGNDERPWGSQRRRRRRKTKKNSPRRRRRRRSIRSRGRGWAGPIPRGSRTTIEGTPATVSSSPRPPRPRRSRLPSRPGRDRPRRTPGGGVRPSSSIRARPARATPWPRPDTRRGRSCSRTKRPHRTRGSGPARSWRGRPPRGIRRRDRRPDSTIPTPSASIRRCGGRPVRGISIPPGRGGGGDPAYSASRIRRMRRR
mmetsp:Transcript_43688/g.132925  ORF Transcript_43688/g.132925 Transcript_43688/m.132925 type:complete len:333 (-) Transcript_43688:649-1647(-)